MCAGGRNSAPPTIVTAHRIVLTGLLVATMGNALVSGVFFAFSSFVMPALSRVSPETGVSAMQAINITVIRSLFLKTFVVTTIVSAMLILTPALLTTSRGAWLACAAGLVSVVGSFAVTMSFNVPLNDALATATPGSTDVAVLWTHFLRDWGVWNSVRTIASFAASVLFLAATFVLQAER
jgi:uncharacterized membrane protein